MKNILFIGTLCDKKHPITTGQTVVSRILLNHFDNKRVHVINSADSGKFQRGSFFFSVFRVFDFLVVYIKLLYSLIFRNIACIYYQPATSPMGIVRDYISLRIIKIFNKPVVGHLLGYMDIKNIESFGLQSFNRFKWVIDSFTRLVVEGDKMKEQLSFATDYEKRLISIPNGFDEEFKGEKEAKSYDGKGPFRILYLSNLIFSKGYYDILLAIDLLVNHYKVNVECVFAGKFYQTLEEVDSNKELGTKEVFDDFVINRRLSSIVKYYPGLYGEDKRDAFLKANAFILPTYYSAEGQPISILEAMSYGCVPIVTNHGHISMMINESNGCFVKPKTPESIVEAILCLINNNSLYQEKSKTAIKDFKAKFDGCVFAAGVESVIDNVKVD